MQIAGGALGWSEEQFWNCSLPYFLASLDGYLEVNGVGGAAQKSENQALADYEDTKRENAAYLNMSDADLDRLRATRAPKTERKKD